MFREESPKPVANRSLFWEGEDMKSGWWWQQEQNGWGKQASLYEKEIHRTWQRTDRMQGAREREVAAVALEVLSLSSGDTREA